MLKPLGNDRTHYFVGRDRRIRRLVTTHELATRLADGWLAIVELQGDPARDFALVDDRTATRLEELGAADWILFWNKPGVDSGDLPTYGAC